MSILKGEKPESAELLSSLLGNAMELLGGKKGE